MNTRLFVGNLSWGTTNESLQNFFATVGTVLSANVIVNKFDGRSKGFGFVEMSTEEEAKKATAELNGKELDGRAIFVNEARPERDRDENSAPGRDQEETPETPEVADEAPEAMNETSNEVSEEAPVEAVAETPVEETPTEAPTEE